MAAWQNDKENINLGVYCIAFGSAENSIVQLLKLDFLFNAPSTDSYFREEKKKRILKQKLPYRLKSGLG